MKLIEETLPIGVTGEYDCPANAVFTYINKAKQLSRLGPGFTTFVPTFIPNLSKAEAFRFAGEIHKTNVDLEIRVVTSASGVAIFASHVDVTWKPPSPPPDEWDHLGVDYPGEDAARAVFDVLAPIPPPDEWDHLGVDYPGEDAAARAVFDVLAPITLSLRSSWKPKERRCPIYELGHETTPDPAEVWETSIACSQAVLIALKKAAAEKKAKKSES